MEPATCRHCLRNIVFDMHAGWVDPEATGDDGMWRTTCDSNHGDRIAAHEPEIKEDVDAGRDRTTSPSINLPQSATEAARAVLREIRLALFEDNGFHRAVIRTDRSNDAGFGITRQPVQTDWLNNAANLYGAKIEDLLDQMEAQL